MPFLKKRGKNPTAKKPRFSTQRRQIVSFLQRQRSNSSGSCLQLVDGNGFSLIDGNGFNICVSG